jgi:hypothetical protein
MTRVNINEKLCRMKSSPLRIVAAGLVLAGLTSISAAHAQDFSACARVEALDLDTLKVGHVTAYFAAPDRERATELAKLSERAATFFEREFGFSFDFRLAVLAPEHWFSEFPAIPYAIPWSSVPERLIFVPSSLEQGLLVEGLGRKVDRRRTVDFVLLHEYGHLAIKEYFFAGSDRDEPEPPWFNELLANVFAYAYVRTSDPEWAERSKEMWMGVVESRTPPVLSLDWTFMNELPPDELAQTYGWYQNLLNLRAAELYDTHGLHFLRALKDQLLWEDSDEWTTASLLPSLERLAPGFEAWGHELESGD